MGQLINNASKNATQNWAPLVEYRREGIAEVVKFGAIMCVEGDRIHYQLGDDILCFGRSLLKPYQMKVFTNELNTLLSPEQKALSLASHNGELAQVNLVHSMLSADQEPFLNTPASMPLVPNKEVCTASEWNHPCSGKHAGVLRGCAEKGWPLEGYQSLTHPYHAAFTQSLQEVLGKDWQAEAVGFDGCGLPAHSFTLSELGQLFSALARHKNDDWIWDSMTQYPELIGGTGRLDTKIMRACHGKVLAKEGADGLLGLAIEHPKYPNGLGIVIKLSHGWDASATGFVAEALLESLGFSVPATEQPSGQQAVVNQAIISSEAFPLPKA